MTSSDNHHRVAFRTFGQPLAHVRTTPSVIKELDGLRWRLRGRCAGDRSGAWFADLRTPAARMARQACVACPVRRRCLAAALLYGEEYGIWGGFAPEERTLLDARLHRGESLDAVVREAARATLARDLDEAV
ncbi:WhiB family transcriptional regulator [Arthrobacter sp. NEB 688]|uniref:WhiB family transcriptional regulator n=1 Tax=Arthrobacter sp. NEB 688 TaxID=904039 RepID=UPI0015641A93|nr:WhiB family transcriptional regulator [Arthrobacter sp. NEB 688]